MTDPERGNPATDPAAAPSKPQRILMIEDDPDIAEIVGIHLRDLHYELELATDGPTGLERALDTDYELVILDLMLPGMDGLEVCRRIRAASETLPILMLTAKSEELDKVVGLELGADDYLTKPFSVRELIARIKALLRRSHGRAAAPAAEEAINVCGISIDLPRRSVVVGGKPVDLTPKEFDLLVLFAQHPGRVFGRDDLLSRVWGYDFEGYGHTVNSHINRLRAKIEADPSNPRVITTVWGVGYRMAETPGD